MFKNVVLVFLSLSELYLESAFKFLKSTIQMKSKTTIIYDKNVTIGKKVNFSSWILFCSATRKSILSFFGLCDFSKGTIPE